MTDKTGEGSAHITFQTAHGEPVITHAIIYDADAHLIDELRTWATEQHLKALRREGYAPWEADFWDGREDLASELLEWIKQREGDQQ